jgi:hypothetical protein
MTDGQKAVLGAAVAAIVAFAIGAGWQYSAARDYRADLEAVRVERDSVASDLTWQSLEATLGAATIEAQRGNHESARRLASDFFTGLQESSAAAPAGAQAALSSILEQRDALITELSRSSLESGGLLAEIFAEYRSALGEPIGPMPAPAAAPPGQ